MYKFESGELLRQPMTSSNG